MNIFLTFLMWLFVLYIASTELPKDLGLVVFLLSNLTMVCVSFLYKTIQEEVHKLNPPSESEADTGTKTHES